MTGIPSSSRPRQIPPVAIYWWQVYPREYSVTDTFLVYAWNRSFVEGLGFKLGGGDGNDDSLSEVGLRVGSGHLCRDLEWNLASAHGSAPDLGWA